MRKALCTLRLVADETFVVHLDSAERALRDAVILKEDEVVRTLRTLVGLWASAV